MQTEFYYHYTTLEGLRGIIENKCIWATEIGFLNDPSEKNYTEDLISQICSENPLFQKVYDHLYNISDKFILYDSDKYITSMSNAHDSLSMWNLYSKGNGFCLKLEKENLFIHDGIKIFMDEIDVIYDTQKQIENLKEVFESYVQKWPEIIDLEVQLEKLKGKDQLKFDKLNSLHWSMVEDFIPNLYKNRNNYKHPAYKEECETRILTQYGFVPQINLKFRSTTNGQIIEYIELPIRIKNIKAIMLHPFICDKLHEMGLKKYLDHMGLPNVKLYKSKIPFRNL